jgi:sigma-B regulation protein RsbU (phosphoserine phosphatase)
MTMKKEMPQFASVDAEFMESESAEDSLQPIDTDDPRNILKRAAAPVRQGEVVAKLSQSAIFVQKDEEIDALAAAMDKAPALFAVGVVDDENVPVGLILRQELFDLLGKPYGREFYKKKPISAVMKESRIFRDDLSIFGVADLLKDEVRRLDDTYYLLTNVSGQFSGIFSTKNLLVYLSDTTARDIALARRIQSAIVKERDRFEDPRCSVLCYSRMAKEVGGDFYLVKRLNANRIFLSVCDVSGKGIAASLITAVLGGVFDTYTGAQGLSVFLRRLNRYLHDTFRLEYFVTGIFIELDIETGESTICDMGHSYVLVREGGQLFRLGKKTSNPPLGIVENLTPALSSFRFTKGGLAFLFTDGMVEQTNPRGIEYSELRLWRLMKSHPSLGPEELQEMLIGDLDGFRGHQPQSDDLTFLIVNYR